MLTLLTDKWDKPCMSEPHQNNGAAAIMDLLPFAFTVHACRIPSYVLRWPVQAPSHQHRIAPNAQQKL